MPEPLVEKHRPETLSDIQGHNKDLKELRQWAETWTPGDSPQLLYGPAGVGKTATVQALANDMGWSIVEVNASDKRTKEDIEDIATMLSSARIDGTRKLLFLDEVDSFSSKTSLTPLSEALADPSCPVMVVGNDDWKIPNAIKKHCTEREFTLGKRSIKAKLREIADAEGYDVSPQDLGKLATRGNLRAAIQDLQRFGSGPVDWDERTDEETSFDAVDTALSGEKIWRTELTPDTLIIWLDENLTKDFEGVEAGMAYDALARADKYAKRFQGGDDYNRFWKYAGQIAQEVGTLRTQEPYSGYIRTSYPQWFRSTTPKASDSSPEATLYRTVSGYDTGTFEFGGGYHYFRQVLLPLLLEMPVGVRLRLAVECGISPDSSALKALGVTKTQYKEWLNEDGGESYREKQQQSISDW